jgi:oleandomycin transport system ATP-binding protein
VTGLLGPNGAGKTTMIRILATLLRPDAGTARVGGYDVVREPQRVQALIGLTGQSLSVDGKLSGPENLAMFGRLHRLPWPVVRERSARLLAVFGLDAAGKKAVRTYSGGMRRKLDLALSLIAEPPVLFLDEPTTGLDPVSRHALWDIIRGLARQGTTVLLTTQYLDEADALAGSVVFLNAGQVVATGTPAELKARAGQAQLDLVAASDADLARLTAALDDSRPAATSGSRSPSSPGSSSSPTPSRPSCSAGPHAADQVARPAGYLRRLRTVHMIPGTFSSLASRVTSSAPSASASATYAAS